MAIDTTFAAGVLTCTGDFGGISSDKVILESTSTPGTVNYDDGSGLGSTTIAGVNSVVFNADDPDFDILRIAGGSAATITSGSYSVLGPTSGTLSYTTTFTPINISFSGLNSTGVTPRPR